MNDETVSTEIENITEDPKPITVTSFDELLECLYVAYNHGVLAIQNVLLDFGVDDVFFTRIKETYTDIKLLFFINCTFSHNMITCDATIEYAIDFTSTTFKCNVDFSRTTFKYNVYCLLAKFEANVDFKATKFEGGGSFESTVFDKKVDFLLAIFKRESDFWSTEFQGEVKFWWATFESHVGFSESKFNREVDFRGANFNNTVNFNDAHFSQKITMSKIDVRSKVSFLNTKFDSGISFFDCNFNDTIQFEKILLPIENNNNELSFSNCSFNSDSLVIVQNIDNNNHNITIENTTIRGGVIMRNIKANSLSLKDSIVTGTVSLSDNVVFKKTIGRRTDCILKHEALKINDNVGYLKYRKQEHIKIYQELLAENKHVKGCTERVVVGLNRISSDFGQRWDRGVLFTFGSAVLFYSLFLCCIYFAKVEYDWTFCTLNFWSIYVNNILEFIWPLSGLKGLGELEIKSVDPCFANYFLLTLGKIIFVMGKIAVGFGIYQTIAAFRRHGK